MELNIPNDKIIDELKKKDVPVKNHMSSIDGEMAEYVRGLFTDKTTVTATKKTAAKQAVAKKVSTVSKPITAKIAAKTAAIKKAAQDKQAAEDAKNPKPVAKPVPIVPPVKALKEEPESEKPRKLGLKVVVKPEETEKKKDTKAPQEKPAAKNKKEEPKSAPAKKAHEKQPVAAPPVEAPVKEEEFEIVQLMDNMPLRDVAEKLKCTPNDIIMDLMTLGSMATINQSLSLEVASKIADQRGFEVEVISPEVELGFEEEEEEDLEKNRILRPPIVTIMGHVDHEKPLCWTPSGKPMLSMVKPAESLSTSVRIRSKSRIR